MKKFLSVLLALAVAFTFTFGSTMSAFAVAGTDDQEESSVEFAGYDKDIANAILDYAYSQATAAAVDVDYDGKYNNQKDVNNNDLDDITVFTIDAKYVQKGIDAAYADSVKSTDGVTSILGVSLVGDYTDATKASSKDAFNVKNALVTAATTTYKDVVEKAAFEDYKAALTKMVESVDLSNYTKTEKENAYKGFDGVDYYTAAEVAAADKAWALDAISSAKYEKNAIGTPASTVKPGEWKTSYENLYNQIFKTVITVKENNDYALNDKVVTSVYYVLSGNYATTKSEAAEEANKAVTQAQAKAALIAAVTTYENNNTLKADAQAQLDAYKEAKTYIIENAKTYPVTYKIDAVDKNGVAATEDGTGKAAADYVDRAAKAAQAKADFATAKNNAAIMGYYYDQTAADKALVAALVNAYDGKDYTVYQGEAALTAGQKASYKKDYSDVKAVKDATYGIDTFTFEKKTYYAKEWEAVKAAVDAYNAAIDTAVNSKDKADADDAYAAALAKIKDVTKINFSGISTALVAQYFALTKANYNADKTVAENIYVTWNGKDYVTNVTDADNNVRGWYLAQGARTEKEVAALYSEACKVIDAYKTADGLKAEAEAVKAAIAALPAKVTLADKDAIVAAYDAYVALNPAFTKYVTNYSTLKADIQAVENLESDATKLLLAKLPTSAAKVTLADKDAVKAALDAFDAYDETTAYSAAGILKHCSFAKYDEYKAALQNVEGQAVIDAYNALKLKYDNNKLTAEDADAVKALQDALAAYIAEYKNVPVKDNVTVNEYVVANIAAAVEALLPTYDNQDAKADLLDMSRKLTIWRTSKTSIKVTAVGSVKNIKDNGYTVQYKFYKKAPGATSYKLVKTTSSNKYTYTNLKKGTNKFQVKVVVKDADGKIVATKMTYYRAAKIK